MADSGTSEALEGFAARPVWHLPMARGVAALLVGLPIVFVQQHDATVGLIAFGIFAALTAAAFFVTRASVPQSLQVWPLTSVAVSAVAALTSFTVAATAPTVMTLSIVVAAWAFVMAGAEGFAWWTSRHEADVRIARLTKDWRSVAIFTLVAAIVFAVLPRHEVVLVGLIGAYAAILGVYLVIAALSARPSKRNEAEVA